VFALVICSSRESKVEGPDAINADRSRAGNGLETLDHHTGAAVRPDGTDHSIDRVRITDR
jgi:hypothetical protein